MNRDAPAAADYDQINTWLARYQRPLVTTHHRPDGDAIGSCLALQAMLKSSRPGAAFYLEEDLLPPAFDAFIDAQDRHTGEDVRADCIVCLDCANAERLALPGGASFDQLQLPSCGIDHHPTNADYTDVTDRKSVV